MLYGTMFAWLQCLREYFSAHLVWPGWASPSSVAGWAHWQEPLLPSWQASGAASVSHTALALHVPRYLGVSELTEPRGLEPTASSHCVQQRVGGAAILVLLQLQRQQGQMGSHPRVFRPSLSFCYLLKISWGIFFENGISLKESSLPEPCPG